jgi:hypothetical protein
LEGRDLGYKPLNGQSGSFELDLRWLPGGMYLLEFEATDGRMAVEKLVLRP